MRSSTVSALYYIAEAGGFGSGTSTPSSARPTTSVGPSVSSSTGKKKVFPLIDPSIMGKEKFPDFARGAVETIAKGPRSAFGLAGDAKGEAFLATTAGVLAAKQAANLPKTFEKETQAQQEGIRNMTNVANFYKGIGAQPRPLHEPDQLGLLQTILKNFGGASGLASK
jgi:hypothetical protein